MTINALGAANAYRNQLKMQQEIQGDSSQDEAAKPSFSNMLQSAAGEAMNTAYGAEATETAALTGKVDLSDLVTAVSNAELTLNTVVAVRDRVISAYQDIIRMPI